MELAGSRMSASWGPLSAAAEGAVTGAGGADDELAGEDELAGVQPAMREVTVAARPSRRRIRGVCMATAFFLSSSLW
jgi:hypothetical protein